MRRSTRGTEIMTGAHPRWDEFCDRLSGPEGIDFQEDGRSKCTSETDKQYATKILASMGDFDLGATLAYFEQHGGFCDCEILLNVDKDEEEFRGEYLN